MTKRLFPFLHSAAVRSADPRGPDEDENKTPGLKEIIGSVLSAAFGVQNRRNRERDFKHGKARTFIIAGIVFTALFIGTVFLVVNVVLRQAGN